MPVAHRSTLHGTLYKCTSILKYSRCFKRPKFSAEEPVPLICRNYKELLRPTTSQLPIRNDCATSGAYPAFPDRAAGQAQERPKTHQLPVRPQPASMDYCVADDPRVFSLLKQNAFSRCYIEKDIDNRLYIVPLLNEREHLDLQIQRVKLHASVRRRAKPEKVVQKQLIPKTTKKKPSQLPNAKKSPAKHNNSAEKEPRAKGLLHGRTISESVRNSDCGERKRSTMAVPGLLRRVPEEKPQEQTKRDKSAAKKPVPLPASRSFSTRPAKSAQLRKPIEDPAKQQRPQNKFRTHYVPTFKPRPPSPDKEEVEEEEEEVGAAARPPERLRQKSRPVFIAQDFYGV